MSSRPFLRFGVDVVEPSPSGRRPVAVRMLEFRVRAGAA